MVATKESFKINRRRVIVRGEQLLRSGGCIPDEILIKLTQDLIALYNNIFVAGGDELRRRAMHVIAGFARSKAAVLDLVFEDAQAYARNQHIDDAFPYSPNSFEVLSLIGGRNPRVIVFLKEVIKTDWGIPRWAAIGALCILDDDTAGKILGEIVQGYYPPKHLGVQDDLRIIERLKGKDFIDELLKQQIVS